MIIKREIEIINTEAAAAIAGLSPRTMERKRIAGTGPRFIKLGKSVRYRTTDIQAWLQANERTSTSFVNANRPIDEAHRAGDMAATDSFDVRGRETRG